jgi:hypothetical protein
LNQELPVLCSGNHDETFVRLWNPPDIHAEPNASEKVPEEFYMNVRDMYGGNELSTKSAFFKKTFQERRTWFALYRAYYRVIAFHVLWFHLLVGLAFAADQRGGSATDAFKGRWWVGMSGAVITHALLSLLYFGAGLYVKAKIPKPPVASSDIRERVEGAPFVNCVSWLVCLCCFRFGAYKRLPTNSEKAQPLSTRLWSAPRVPQATTAVKQFFMMLVFVALFAILLFLFLAQFSWFPWEDGKLSASEEKLPLADQPKALMIGGKSAGKFFRE